MVITLSRLIKTGVGGLSGPTCLPQRDQLAIAFLPSRSRLEEHSIEIYGEKVVKLEGDNDGYLQRICLIDGKAVDRAAMFFTTGCTQRSDLWKTLGCRRDEKGGIIRDPETEESSVPGVYVAGDASRDVLLVAVAIAEGAKAAVAINRALPRMKG